MSINLDESWKAIVAVGTVVAAGVGVAANFASIYDTVAPFFGQRVRLHLSVITTDDVEEGNTLIITNLSSKPLHFDHWQLVWVRPKRFGKTMDVKVEEQSEFDDFGGTIAANDRVTWRFYESSYFTVGGATRKGLHLILRFTPTGGGSPYNLSVWP